MVYIYIYTIYIIYIGILVFPSDMKIVKIIPLFKKGNRCDPGNYCPISILSVASKILERIANNQMNEYLTKSSLIYVFQSGFRKSHSTDTSLLYLTDFIRRQIDEGKMCGMVLLDLQKAFDSSKSFNTFLQVKCHGFFK